MNLVESQPAFREIGPISVSWQLTNYEVTCLTIPRSTPIIVKEIHPTPDCSLKFIIYPCGDKIKVLLENGGQVDIAIYQYLVLFPNDDNHRIYSETEIKPRARFAISETKRLSLVDDLGLSFNVTLNLKVRRQSSGLLFEDLSKAFNQNEMAFTDWTIVCQGKEVPCHRFLLAARSKVFNRIVKGTPLCQRLEIANADLASVQAMLKFIYTDTVDADDCSNGNLFALAATFQIPNLQTRCEQILGESINVDNAGIILQLAKLHESRFLEDKCLKVMGNKFTVITRSHGWPDLKNENASRGRLHKLFCALRRSKKSFSKVGRRHRTLMDRAISMILL